MPIVTQDKDKVDNNAVPIIFVLESTLRFLKCSDMEYNLGQGRFEGPSPSLQPDASSRNVSKINIY